jgi:dolichol-phosphate mannosyltransferase
MTESAMPLLGTGTWVVLPTYDEAENLPSIAQAILAALPGATLLVVDDGSPDGTGRLADGLAADNPRVRVRHRPGKAGLGKAYLEGFQVALEGGATSLVQMDADWSHDPLVLPALLEPITSAPTWSSAAATSRAGACSTGGSAGGSSRGWAASSPRPCSDFARTT